MPLKLLLQAKVWALVISDPSEADGVNNRIDLAKATAVLQERIVRSHLLKGVSFADPNSVTVEPSVVIERDVVIERGVVLKGNTEIEEDVTIGAYSVLDDTIVEIGATIHSHSHCKGAQIGPSSTIGPFARLREGTEIGVRAKVGNLSR